MVSGSFWKGAPREILIALADHRFDLVLSTEIFSEYRSALSRLMKAENAHLVEDLLNMLGSKAHWVDSAVLPNQVCTDPDDDKFIAAAVIGVAEFIVSGDKALLKVGHYGQIKIETARRFLALLK